MWRIAALLDWTALCLPLRGKLASRVAANEEDRVLYEEAVLNLLYQRYYRRFFDAGLEDQKTGGAPRWRFYTQFLTDWRYFFDIDGLSLPSSYEPAHTFACFRQLQRAFEHIFLNIIGNSMPAARLRAAVWQSIFTHDMRRYRRTLFERMGEFVTLITGPSGTGKELVARAIAESPYLRFDERRMTFPDEEGALFYPINISALSPTLVESELFGHRRGSFTGAIGDRAGWLETCSAHGSVFVDELGDLEPGIQVKLLRVIETRRFNPVGDTASLRFQGKLIAATNRDLASDIQSGRFREDLYYRLCSDQISTAYRSPRQTRRFAAGARRNRSPIWPAKASPAPNRKHWRRRRCIWVERNLGAGLFVAGQLSRTGAVRPQCADPAGLPAFADGDRGDPTADQLARESRAGGVSPRTSYYADTVLIFTSRPVVMRRRRAGCSSIGGLLRRRHPLSSNRVTHISPSV